MNLHLKSLTAGVAALLLMSGIFATQALAGQTAKPVISSPSTKSCVVGAVCSYTITATNSPTSYNATGLQSWQTRTTNVITGTPTTAGTFSVTVSATNAGGTGSLVVAFTVSPPPARVVVAPSGGDYTTISAAMAAINPTAFNPVVIEVWPGVYIEPSAVYLKNYVHIKGSGRDVTTVKTADSAAGIFEANGVVNVTISGLTMTEGRYGVNATNNSSLTITDNTMSNHSLEGLSLRMGTSALVTGNNFVGSYWDGVSIWGNSTSNATVTISGNYIAGNGHGHSNSSTGIYLDRNGPGLKITISGNVITGNNGFGIEMFYDDSNPTISNNVITNNTMAGVAFEYDNSWGTLVNNRIVNNGGTLFPDIKVGINPNSAYVIHNPNISFNVFDDISTDSTRAVGSFNVNSNGDPILVP